MIAFVILHYISIDETLKCLTSLRESLGKNNYKTIVVDNHSLKFNEEKEIRNHADDLILLDKNYGFAKANNIGCQYAQEKYNPDFIAVINNDVYISQKEFIKIINNDYKKFKFDILGPWIDSPSHESCNPFPLIYSKKKIEEQIKKTKKLIKIYKNPLLSFLLKYYMNVKHFIKKPIIPTNGKKIEMGVGLHGCALIFSKKYLKKYITAFYNETFLFYEEEFLYKRIVEDKLISVYDPLLKVYHQEGSSLKKNKNNRLSKLFKEQEKLKSLELLLKQP